MPIGVRADDDIGKLLGFVQAALHLDAKLEGFATVIGRLADGACRHLHILRAQGSDDLARRQVERGGTSGVDPHTHRIVARAEQLHVAHAVEPREAITHLRQGVVGEVVAVERPVG